MTISKQVENLNIHVPFDGFDYYFECMGVRVTPVYHGGGAKATCFQVHCATTSQSLETIKPHNWVPFKEALRSTLQSTLGIRVLQVRSDVIDMDPA